VIACGVLDSSEDWIVFPKSSFATIVQRRKQEIERDTHPSGVALILITLGEANPPQGQARFLGVEGIREIIGQRSAGRFTH
jgi:hypothetical protein